MDKFSEMRAFTSVVQAGGFSAAARQTGQSRSAVNRLVIALEERLGVQLLHRTTRSVSATSTGQAVYERARQILDDLDELEQSVSALRTEPAGKLRLSAPSSFGDLDFSALTTQFMARHPKVEIEIQMENRLVDPIAEGFDLVIRVAEPDEETILVDHRILTLDYQLCASPGYLARQKPPTNPADLAEHATLFQRQSGKHPAWSLEGPAGVTTVAVKPILIANNLETLLAASCAGLGIAALPVYATQSDAAAGRLQIVLPEYRLPQRILQVIYPPARHLSAKVRLFVDFVEAWCAAPGLASD